VIDKGNNNNARLPKNAFLARSNDKKYVPTGDYNPATKKYVDDKFKKIDDKFKKINDVQWSIVGGKVPSGISPSFEVFTPNTKEFGFGVNDYLDLGANECPHSWQEQKDIELHMHITTKIAVVASPRYAKFEVFMAKCVDRNQWEEDTFTAELTIPAGTDALVMFYLEMGQIDMSGYYLGSELKPRVRRIAATGGTDYTGNIFITQLGGHFLSDAFGSQTEIIK